MESSKLTKSTSINQIEENDDDTKINTTSNNNSSQGLLSVYCMP